jgi:hypothetical protein
MKATAGKYFSLKSSGKYMHHLTLKKRYILPIQCIYIFPTILEVSTDYFYGQHQSSCICNDHGRCSLSGIFADGFQAISAKKKSTLLAID